MPDQRPSPENFLQRAQEEENRQKRGKLKIYLGAAPGVGKTWAMLHDALDKRASDLDVVVGIVESHGREDIEALLKNFEVIPRQSVQYRDTIWHEMDLNAILQRDPGLILIDEMAHTNAPGLSHAKRWQDINEVLERGIDVYTTLNVQHIESLKDDIAQVIHAPISETVPDSIIERADTIELVDLPPEDLLKRLKEGKVYIPEQAALAVEHFFRKGNLIALREFALRTAAERVRADVLLYRQGEGIKHIWPTRDKILVCVGPKPGSLNLIRTAKRMANSLHAEWIAVYVDTPQRSASVLNKNKAIQNLRQAELLGAQTHVLTNSDVVKTILSFAREQNVTQIIIRKQVLNRWRDLFVRTLADEMVRYSGDIDIYIVTRESGAVPEKIHWFNQVTPWKAYGIAIGIVVLATLFNYSLHPFLARGSMAMVYLLSIIIIAMLGQRGPSILGSVLSVLAYGLFFIPESHRFELANIKYFPSIVVMLLVAQIISHFTIKARRQAESASLNQRQTTALYTFSRQLTATRGVDNLLSLGTKYIASVFNCEVEALLPVRRHHEIKLMSSSRTTLDIKDQGIAQWVYEMGKPAGLGTDTLASSNALYLPISESNRAIGVLRIKPKSELLLTPEQMGLMESCINQLALALEVERLHEQERKEALKTETDRARSLLLLSISNDLHKPLNIVINALGKLNKISGSKIRQIENELDSEIERLSHLNNNIVQIMYLESGDASLQKVPCSIEKIIILSLKISNKILKTKQVNTKIQENLPSVLLNKKLMQDVFVNLFDNAVNLMPVDSAVHVYVYFEKNNIMVMIHGSDSDLTVAGKHYQETELITEHGLGLGLYICKKIIEAHGGKIWVENVGEKNTVFRFTLPVSNEM